MSGIRELLYVIYHRAVEMWSSMKSRLELQNIVSVMTCHCFQNLKEKDVSKLISHLLASMSLLLAAAKAYFIWHHLFPYRVGHLMRLAFSMVRFFALMILFVMFSFTHQLKVFLSLLQLPHTPILFSVYHHQGIWGKKVNIILWLTLFICPVQIYSAYCLYHRNLQ